jgi:hypothetical protein
MATSGRSKAIEILESLRNDLGISDKELLEYIICNWMSGAQAEEALVDYCKEYDIACFEE